MAVSLVVRAVVVVAGGGGNADDDGEAATVDAAGLVEEVEAGSSGVGRNTGFVRVDSCVLSCTELGTVAAWLEVLASEVVELEVGKAVEVAEVGGAVASAGTVEVKNNASLVAVVAVVAAEDGIDVELDATS